MEFRILTQLDGSDIYEGMHIEYIVRPLFGIPMRWKTEIGPTRRLQFFTDKQIKGPYKVWEHTHTFTQVEGGVLMQDVVYYELPMGILGNIAHQLLVKKKIEKIFAYRTKVLNTLFKSK
jgi:ligand-binding SRPBCC domain-containing protein